MSSLVTNLAHALFREYLKLHGFKDTYAAFEAESAQKGFEKAYAKRADMLVDARLYEVCREEQRNAKDPDFLRTTLELMIREHLRHTEGRSRVENPPPEARQAAPKAGQPESLWTARRAEAAEPAYPPGSLSTGLARSARGSSVRLPEDAHELPADSEGIFQRPAAEGSRVDRRAGPQAASTVALDPRPLRTRTQSLTSYLASTSGRDGFMSVLFNDKRTATVPDTWYQSLTNISMEKAAKTGKDLRAFSTADPHTWGVHQREGGPCGVLAVLQARACKYLFLGKSTLIAVAEGPSPQSAASQYRSAMLSAVFETLQVIHSGLPQPAEMHLVLPHAYAAHSEAPAPLECDRVIEEMDRFQVLSVQDLAAVQGVVSSRAYQDYAFQPLVSSFLPCFVASCVLSRGVDTILAQDFDASGGTGAAGSIFANMNNSSQELVNLLITGRATAGLHDGDRDLDGLVLQGVSTHCDVGLLSIYEHYDYMRIADRLKYALDHCCYVCFNEAHYTVLFARDAPTDRRLREWLRAGAVPGSESVDIVYYDSLDDQHDNIVLTVTLAGRITRRVESDGVACASFVDSLLYTLFGEAIVSIDWNGTEPYL